MKVALIDIGSNTSKLLIAQRAGSNTSEHFTTIEEDSLPCRLIDSSTNHDGVIDQQKLESLLLCLQKFKKTCERYGVKYIVHPGGSIQDDNVRDACDEYDMVMALSGKRLFLH